MIVSRVSPRPAESVLVMHSMAAPLLNSIARRPFPLMTFFTSLFRSRNGAYGSFASVPKKPSVRRLKTFSAVLLSCAV